MRGVHPFRWQWPLIPCTHSQHAFTHTHPFFFFLFFALFDFFIPSFQHPNNTRTTILFYVVASLHNPSLYSTNKYFFFFPLESFISFIIAKYLNLNDIRNWLKKKNIIKYLFDTNLFQYVYGCVWVCVFCIVVWPPLYEMSSKIRVETT